MSSKGFHDSLTAHSPQVYNISMESQTEGCFRAPGFSVRNYQSCVGTCFHLYNYLQNADAFSLPFFESSSSSQENLENPDSLLPQQLSHVTTILLFVGIKLLGCVLLCYLMRLMHCSKLLVTSITQPCSCLFLRGASSTFIQITNISHHFGCRSEVNLNEAKKKKKRQETS